MKESKPGLAVLLGSISKSKSDKEDGSNEGVDLMREWMDAMKDEDPETAFDAFKALYAHCKEEHEESDSDNEEY